MRKRSSSRGGLLLLGALVSGLPGAASAATPKHRPRAATPHKKPAAPKDAPAVSSDDQPATPEPDKPAGPTDKPAPPTEKPPLDAAPVDATAKPSAKPDAPSIPDAPGKADDTQPPASATEASSRASDDAALGRREAARIAAGRILVAVWATGGVATRHFKYSDPVGRVLAVYRLPVAPIASFGVEAYPAASTDVPVLRDLGLRGRLSRGFAFDSKTPQGVTLATTWTRFGGELRERTLLPGPHAFELGLFAGLDASYFGITSKQAVAALFPSARTVALRFGFDAQVLVAWRLSVMLGGAYLVTTTAGEIYDHFRKPKVGGVDADYGVAVDVAPGFQARLTGRYTRYFATFKPTLGDRYVAGGALDEQMQFGLGVRYAH